MFTIPIWFFFLSKRNTNSICLGNLFLFGKFKPQCVLCFLELFFINFNRILYIRTYFIFIPFFFVFMLKWNYDIKSVCRCIYHSIILEKVTWIMHTHTCHAYIYTYIRSNKLKLNETDLCHFCHILLNTNFIIII